MTEVTSALARPPARAEARAARFDVREVVGYAALACLLVACVAIALAASARRSYLVSVEPGHFPAWVSGPLHAIGFPRIYEPEFLLIVIAMWGCYGAAVLTSDRLRTRAALGVVVALHVVILLAPPLLSTDIFSYLDYARLGTIHGINPYVHPPSYLRSETLYPYVGIEWKHTLSAYGPLFTLLSYPLALLGLAGAIWSLKAVAALSSLACVGIVWWCARRLGRDPLRPALLVGLNPLVVVYAVGGGHNDLLMLALMTGGVALALAGRERVGSAAVVAGAAVKATAAMVWPFMFIGLRDRRPGLIAGAIVALVAIAIPSFIAFGVHGIAFVDVLREQQRLVAADSFPNIVAHAFGLPGVVHEVRLAARGLLVIGVLVALVAAWRGADWIVCAGWALLTLAVTTTFLVAWYTLWSLPLAAISRDRRLIAATVGVEAIFFAHQLTPLLR